MLFLAAVAVLVLAGCGGSTPTGPPELLFVSTTDGDYAIFGADAKGKHVRRLTKTTVDATTKEGLFFQLEPAWSSDGRSIAFASLRDGTSHIYVMQADGAGTRRVTNGKQDDDHPSWSPDGKQIVFSREGALFVVRASGGAAHRVGHGTGRASNPAWSRDGRWIAYDYRRPGFSIRELYLMRADGTGIRRLTKLSAVSAVPSWSPDGKRIAFQSNVRSDHFEAYTIRPDGTGVQQVTQSVVDVIQPSFTPDGKVGFARDGQIWIDDGETETKLTSGTNDSNPVWRPVPPE